MPDPWLPSVDDVAAFVRVRTKDNLGNEVGTFNTDTRPTATQVTELITAEAPLILVQTGPLAGLTCASVTDVQGAAKTLIAKRVAAIIEASYRPEEIAAGATVEDFYEGQYKDDVAAAVKATYECRAETEDPGGAELGPLHPSYTFTPLPQLGRW